MKQNIAELISTARKDKNISMRELGRLSSITNSEISKIESGKRPMPKLKTLKALCRYLDIYYEECLYVLNLGGTYNVDNTIITDYYQNMDEKNLRATYKSINGQINEINNQLFFMKNKLFEVKDKDCKDNLIDTIKSLEFQNKTNNYIKSILEEKIIKNYLSS
ncbi:MAG: helix-turn-helix domain-containing protein [Candidatus Coprovivens sp.]